MRYIFFAVVIAMSTLLTSCLTIEEKITFNTDGSGSYSSFIDMGEALSNPMIMMGMKQELEKSGKDMMEMKLDSTIDIFNELVAKNPNYTDAEKDLLRGVQSKMLMDLEKGEGGIYVNYAFKNVEELALIQRLMRQADKNAGGNPIEGMSKGSGPLAQMENSFTWKKGKFSRLSTMPVTDDMFKSLGIPEADEALDAIKMMMEDAVIIYSVTFPGKIKKVTGFEGHVIEGNTLVQAFDFLDAIEDPAAIDAGLDGEVKFKKK